ncbi:hypothetical protein ACJMK2_033557 [Sinanodonta woodiana]|uniref:Uncharacterized protein n=1 Tax=Sinanodonta woodiana TaxID=1069815 RepID=A0ABD3WQ28_SINWO
MTEEIYSFKHKPRGLAVVIVNKMFDNFGVRYGADKDLINMKTLFKKLNFRVKAYKNLSGDKMIEKLKKASKRSHAESDCFVCVISTHGEDKEHYDYEETTVQHVLYGTDSKFIYTSAITRMFANCPGLVDKPKLFFIQADRSLEGHAKADLGHQFIVVSKSEFDQSHRVHSDKFPTQESVEACKDGYEDVSEDEWQESQLSDNWMKEDEEGRFCQETEQDAKRQRYTAATGLSPSWCTCCKDELVMWQVASGLCAPRHSIIGSSMLTCLFEELMKIQPTEPLLHALTRVCSQMAKISSASGNNAVPCISHRLCKEIYFTQI